MAPTKRQRVRLRDVAEHAQVSLSTASFVLSGRDMRIAEATRERVLRTARELDYRLDLTARTLRTRVSTTIALVTDTIATGHYGGELIRGTLTEALRRDHLLLLCESGSDPDLESTLVDTFASRQVDGLIFATASHERIVVPRLRAGQRAVLLNCRSDGDLPAILAAEEDGGRAAATLLLDAGHRRDVWVVGETPPTSLPGSERMVGIQGVLAAAGVPIARHLACSWWPEAARETVAVELAVGAPPRAIVCLNDRVAFGVYQALDAAGYRIPTDVSVVSFDDSELATWVRPALTSIGLPEFAMGRLAVTTLLTDGATPAVQRVPMPVRVRHSVAPPLPG